MSSCDAFTFDEQNTLYRYYINFAITRPAPTESSSSTSTSSSATKSPAKPPAPAPSKKSKSADPDDFLSALSDSEDEGEEGGEGEDVAEAAARKEAIEKERKDEEERKEKARALGKKAAKSTLILDIKPEDDETDLDQLEASIRSGCAPEGLLWGQCQRIPIAFGIKKLRMIAVVVDDLVSTDDLQESIEALEGVQSTDIHAFNKI